MEIVQFIADALGDASYLVVSGTSAAVVDPQRDVRPYLRAAEERGARIESVVETHVHNDYVSGGRELAERGAEVVLPAGSGVEFPHRAVHDEEDIAIGAARLRAVFAPGHTHHHTAYLAIDEEGTTRGAFTGGALIIGGAARTDLLGAGETEELTRLQWESGRRIARLLEDRAEILPTHGQGSFCSVGDGIVERRAPLGAERARNVVLTSPDYASFRARQLDNPGPIPAYYQHIAPINRRGPRLYGEPPPPRALDAQELRRLQGEGIPVIDARPRFDVARGHVPGALAVQAGSVFLPYLSWLTPFDSPLLLVTEDTAQAEALAVDLLRIGYEDLRGYMPFRSWLDAGGDAESFDTADLEEAEALFRSGVPHLDVRFANEHAASPLPGARPLPFERIAEWVDDVREERVLLSCSSGVRATAVASVLRRRGTLPTIFIEGGAGDFPRRDAGR